MLTTGRIDEPWVEIIPPSAPAAALDAWVVWLAVSALVLLLAGIVIWYRRPGPRAVRGLRRLDRRLRRAAIEPRPACLLLAAQLRRALAVDRLDSHRVEPEWQAAWQAFRQTLNGYCFAAEAPAAAEAAHAIEAALAWLDMAGKMAGKH